MALLLSKLFVLLLILALLQIAVLADQSQAISHKPVVVQGSVYCKACKSRGSDSVDGATPLEGNVDAHLNLSYHVGAVVKLSCKSAQNPLVQEAKTNKHGNFLFKKPKRLSQEEFMACKASLVSSSVDSCNIASDLNSGLSGSTLSQIHKITTKKPLKYDIFTIKPFAFEPSAEGPCDEHEPYEIDEVICNPQCVLINYGCYC